MGRRTIERATDDGQRARGRRGAASAVTAALAAALVAGAGACTHPEPRTGSTAAAPSAGEECAASTPAPTALPTLPIEPCKATPRKP
ncbi:MAG: hypothetical protein IT373_23195 [Polyangiaceae bacterium]|nr:hypothetical protein [Polyangiaceae bacterium]